MKVDLSFHHFPLINSFIYQKKKKKFAAYTRSYEIILFNSVLGWALFDPMK